MFAILVSMIETWFWIVATAVFGMVAGSFAGAQVWRLRFAQLKSDKAEKRDYDTHEYTKLKVLAVPKGKRDRSRCLQCGHTLAWHDLVPLLSWLSTAGRCRYCKKRIGWFEPVIELATMLVFVGSYLLWPFEHNSYSQSSLLIVWLLALVPFAIGFVYDLKWSYLPDISSYILIVLGAVYASLGVATGSFAIESVLYSAALFAGVYGALYYFSLWRYGPEKTWVGFGDVKLSIALGLFLADWQLSFLAIFLANFIGTLIVLPGLVTGRLNRKARIPFGPLLIIGAILALLLGSYIMSWYLSLFSL